MTITTCKKTYIGIPGSEIDFLLHADGNLGSALDLGVFLFLGSRFVGGGRLSGGSSSNEIGEIEFIELGRVRFERFEVFEDVRAREEDGGCG